MNICLDQNFPTQPNNCRFLRRNGQRPFLLSEHLTLSVMPDWKNKKFGPEEVQKVVFCFKKNHSIFFIYFLWLLGWKQTSEELRWTSIHLRYYAYQQTQWWSRCSNQNLQSKVIPTWKWSWPLMGVKWLSD